MTDAFARCLAEAPAGPIGLAVSGGSDSMALLALARDWAQQAGRALAVATVDHGLRAESAEEARQVGHFCQGLGLSHEILAWGGWDGRGNLAEAARDARRALLSDWARGRGIGAIALGHTADDQAETFLMRLARGSGIGGLAAMAEVVEAAGLLWLRPLLGQRRADLRAMLTARGWDWVEDPTNQDMTHDRVKARAMLGELSALGLTVDRLTRTARHMAEARDVLDMAEAALAAETLRLTAAGEARVTPDALADAPRAVRLQFLADLLTVIGGAAHPPRLDALERLAERIAEGQEGGTSLHGCLIRLSPARILIRREPARLPAREAARPRQLWDRRWLVTGAGGEGVEIGPLGAGKAAPAGVPAEVAQGTPALWRGETLVAAPGFGPDAGWQAEFFIPDARRRRMFTLR